MIQMEWSGNFTILRLLPEYLIPSVHDAATGQGAKARITLDGDRSDITQWKRVRMSRQCEWKPQLP